MQSFNTFDHEAWDRRGLKHFGEYSEAVTYHSERPSGYGDSEGSWFYADADALVIYLGSHGNDHSPGASSYTTAECYAEEDRDDPEVCEREAFAARVAELENLPEWIGEDDDEED